MSQQAAQTSRFVRLAREVLNGSYPYGPSPGQPSYAMVFSCDYTAGATLIFVVGGPEEGMAFTLRNVSGDVAERVVEDVNRFIVEAGRGDDGTMLPFSYLPPRVARRRLRKLIDAN